MKIFKTKIYALPVIFWLSIASVVCGSDYDGTVSLDSGQHFWNVQGSTNDAHPIGYNSWVDLWSSKTRGIKPYKNNKTKCFAMGNKSMSGAVRCSTVATVGGHIVLDPIHIVPEKSNGRNFVYIMPICSWHNNSSRIGSMTLAVDTLAVRLINYKCPRGKSNKKIPDGCPE